MRLAGSPLFRGSFLLLACVAPWIAPLIALITISSCGVKAPPLPPQGATPQQSDLTAWDPRRNSNYSSYPQSSPKPSQDSLPQASQKSAQKPNANNGTN